ncbi:MULTISPECIES: hypothetical protein [unclassified Spirosoma]|uniref:LGFP repeat-containing protein n=1 Tax=unclassified Spirosoma TaxID=2621999 RepID=UPI00096008A9|nr:MULTISPECIES: hypothetical protein [unclassified Spirosoma]MBN8821129.1 hypothetical protein [Spirosoma sp.]OJW79236.1 MAG: hypothetical protein BGO59_11880 [Spirosoma sp. 48-14]
MNQFRFFKPLIWIALLSIGVSCKKRDSSVDTGLSTLFSDKYKALGWDTQNITKVGEPQKTKGGNGYVQYYSYNGKTLAIYHSNAGTFGMAAPDLVSKYDALGQETFKNSALGYPTSDMKVCGSGCVYAEFERGVILKSTAVSEAVTVYGEIYKKYTSLNRWDGVLGYPTTDELDLTSKRGRYNVFKGGQIYWGSTTGAQAFWGKTQTLYGSTGYDTGWLGLPVTSTVNNYSGLSLQRTGFEKGSIIIDNNGNGCGSYNNVQGDQVFSNQSIWEWQKNQKYPCY